MKKSPKFTHVHARRLLKLAAFLETLPPKRFDYDRWVGDNWRGAPDLSCGTTACALGWATTMKEFRRLGLRLTAPDTDIWSTPVLKGSRAMNKTSAATKSIFGVNWAESQFLFAPNQHFYPIGFSPSSLASAKKIAKHIRKFVAWKRKQPK